MRIKAIFFSVLAILSLTQCATYDFSKPIVQQGNLIKESNIRRLKLGMSKDDVAILMGTSLISPTFNNDRWDYAYTYRKRGGALLTRRIVLYFNHQRLSHIEYP